LQILRAEDQASGIPTSTHRYAKRIVTIVSLAAMRMGRGASAQRPVLDDRSVLHIRCGHDIMEKLADAGFEGDFLWFGDPYVQGPVPRSSTLEEFVRIRAQFLEPQTGGRDVFGELHSAYRDLERARDYSQVNIWLEHDSYDQLVLAKLLHDFSEPSTRPPRLRMMVATHYPGVARFIGLGQLPPEALRALWSDFHDVTEGELALGKSAWDAVTSATPEALANLVKTGTPALPAMTPALRRHLRELPSIENGLGLTEHLTLQILGEKGAVTGARLFSVYTNEYEPLPFLGDSGYWTVLSGLATARTPALRITPWVGRCSQIEDAAIESLPFGRTLIDRRADWLHTNDIDRWIGGVRIDSRQPQNWRVTAQGDVLLAR
jgi:hypothetical protein